MRLPRAHDCCQKGGVELEDIKDGPPSIASLASDFTPSPCWISAITLRNLALLLEYGWMS